MLLHSSGNATGSERTDLFKIDELHLKSLCPYKSAVERCMCAGSSGIKALERVEVVDSS